MSFLESIQHSLEKASQEATRLAKIQHLHHVVNDLTFKVSQEGQTLIEQAMNFYHNGQLTQGELTAICQQISTYQQQINEVQEELQRLQHPEDNAGQQATPIAPPPTGYPAQAAYTPQPGYPPQPIGYTPQPGYPPQPVGYTPQPGYPPQPAGYTPQPGYPAYPNYPAYPASPSGEPPTKPGTASQEAPESLPTSGEPPTKPGAASQEAQENLPTSSKTPTKSGKTRQEIPAGFESTATSAPGSYAQGVLPPVYSPFANHPTPTEEAATPEPEKPSKAHHSAKKADHETGESAEAPVKEKKAHKATEPQA